MLEERLAKWSVLDFIRVVAERSEDFARYAGVGGTETAGHLLSYLATHPNDIEPFMVGGFEELPEPWIESGCLTWHAANGKVVHPRTVRFNRIVKGLRENNDAG